tara:strand:+ start:1495 stop:1851 length:357 start_codon:yes stop_codon:yes gene_type:complete
MRDYNYRKDKQERFVKQRILNIAYQQKHYSGTFLRYNRRSFVMGPNCNEKDPEDKWFNYLGEYTPRYKTSYDFQMNRRYIDWGETWKEKYLLRRARSKRINKNKIDEQIGQTYYIFNK